MGFVGRSDAAFNEDALFEELGVVGGTEAEDREELTSLVFTKPSQLLKIFSEIEEQNVTFDHHAQVNEEELEAVEKNLTESRVSL